MKIWRVKINYEARSFQGYYWGTAKDYLSAAELALKKAAKEEVEADVIEGLWVDEIVCYGEKQF